MTTRNLNRSIFDNLTFGIEIETVGSRRRVAAKIAEVLGGRLEYVGGYYDKWAAVDSQGRKWITCSDSSVTGGGCEVVSPVLTWGNDIDTLQTVVRSLRKAGAYVDSSCGVHIHIGAQDFDAKKIANLCKLVYKQENILFKALDIESRSNWAAKIGECRHSFSARNLMQKINAGKIKSMDDLNREWYGYTETCPSHYDSSRYQGLNLHNLWYRSGNARTIEFRWFKPTIDGRRFVHAGQIKAYVALCLALGTKALTARGCSARERREYDAETAAYDWRVFLVCTLCLKGDEFKNARKWLMHNVEGDSAYRGGRKTPEAAETVPAPCTPAEHAAQMSANA